ncbi:MAG: glycosyltransferase family 2 protein [Bacteroidota bacterium]
MALLNKSPLVSIIIPTYNQSSNRKNTLYSAANLDYENMEIIVSNDNSTDVIESIVKETLRTTSIIKYYKNSKSLGEVDNYIKALCDYASREYVLCINRPNNYTINE